MRAILFLFLMLLPLIGVGGIIYASAVTRPARVENRVRSFLYRLNAENGVGVVFLDGDLIQELKSIIKSIENQ